MFLEREIMGTTNWDEQITKTLFKQPDFNSDIMEFLFCLFHRFLKLPAMKKKKDCLLQF